MEKSKSLDDNYFIKNAILCWLHHYGDQGHRWDSIYKELAQRDTYINMASIEIKDAQTEPDPPKPRTTRKRTNATKPAKTV